MTSSVLYVPRSTVYVISSIVYMTRRRDTVRGTLPARYMYVYTSLETTFRQMAPPKGGQPLECHLNQVAFPESWLNICAPLNSTPGRYSVYVCTSTYIYVYIYRTYMYVYVYVRLHLAICAFNSSYIESSEESDATPRVLRFPPAICMCEHTYIQNCAVLYKHCNVFFVYIYVNIYI